MFSWKKIWKMFCISPHTCGCKNMFDLSWEKIRLIWKNDNWHQYWSLGTKTWPPWNMMMWSRCTGMIGNWAPPALYHSVLRSWTGNIFPFKVEIHHFCIGNLEMCSPSKFAKGQFQPMFDNLKPDFPGCDSFQFISKTSKGTRQDDVQIQIYIKQPA